MNSASAVIQARRLGRRFGTNWALAHVDLDIANGERVLLAGANGSGKTTLLRIVAGLIRRSKGELDVFGIDPQSQNSELRRKITLVSHSNYLYPRLTARETVALWCRLAGRRELSPEEILREVGLDTRSDRVTQGFSAGMKKRLSLARVRIEEPQLLLLDEPFAALDPPGRRLLQGWIDRFCEGGGTLVMTSHELELAAPLCSRAILLDQGQILWRGPADQVQATWENLS